ncbi:MAG: YIP1 family protein [Bacteroidota bacterium]
MELGNKAAKMIMAGLKFSKSEIDEVASSDKYTKPAVWLIAFSAILGAVIAFFKGNGGSSGIGRMGLVGFNAAIAEFGSLLIGTFLSALIMVYVIRIFKVKPTFNNILGIYGAAIIWTILKQFVGLALPEGLAMVGVLFWLAYNFAVLFGLMGHTKLKWWQALLTIILTFAVIFGIMIVYGIVAGVIFA